MTVNFDATYKSATCYNDSLSYECPDGGCYRCQVDLAKKRIKFQTDSDVQVRVPYHCFLFDERKYDPWLK